jgi:urease subunit alpha
MDDPKASISTPQPIPCGPLLGPFGHALAATGLTHVPQTALGEGVGETPRLAKSLVAVTGVRTVRWNDMIRDGPDAKAAGRSQDVGGAR